MKLVPLVLFTLVALTPPGTAASPWKTTKIPATHAGGEMTLSFKYRVKNDNQRVIRLKPTFLSKDGTVIGSGRLKILGSTTWSTYLTRITLPKVCDGLRPRLADLPKSLFAAGN